MAFRIPEVLLQQIEVKEEAVKCPVCGNEECLVSGMAICAGEAEAFFDATSPKDLRCRQVSDAPGVFTMTANCLCREGHWFNFVFAMNFDNMGCSAGTFQAKEGVSVQQLSETIGDLDEAARADQLRARKPSPQEEAVARLTDSLKKEGLTVKHKRQEYGN